MGNTYLFFWKTEWGSNSQLSSSHVNTQDNWILSIDNEVLQDLQSHGEDRSVTSRVLSRILTMLDVFGKLVEQVIDDVSCENLNSFLVSELLGIVCHLYIECKNTRKLFFYLVFFLGQHFGCLHDIILVNGSYSNIAHWDLGCCFQKL